MFRPKNEELNNLLKKLHLINIEDDHCYWYRNKETLKKIRSSNLFRDEIISSLEEEKDQLISYL